MVLWVRGERWIVVLIGIGRSEKYETVHYVLLPICCVQLEQCEPGRTHEDHAKR